MFAIFLAINAFILHVEFANCLGPLPDASQEGLLWPWKGYASVALFHFHVPEESTRATFEFASFQGLYDYPGTKDLLNRYNFMFHKATCFDYLRYLT